MDPPHRKSMREELRGKKQEEVILAGILSLLTSTAGLPEVSEEE